MRFHIKKRRQAPTVIIVALIDILIVMLIFIIVTSTFKQQPALKLALPESSQAKKSGATEEPPLMLSIDTNGTYRIGPQARPVTYDTLKETLLAEVGRNPGLTLGISADKAAPFGQVVKAYDAAAEAGMKPGSVRAFAQQPAKP